MGHYVVIGVTGPSGLAFAQAALKAQNNLTLYLRNISKLDASLKEDERVRVVIGVLSDEVKLREALEDPSGKVDGVISFAGPVAGATGTPVTDGYKVLIPLLESLGIKRFLGLSTPSYLVPEDRQTLKWKAAVLLIKLIGGSAYLEITSLSALIASSPLDYTLFRVPFLTNGEEGNVEAGYLGDGGDGLTLSRKSLARWCLTEIERGEWIRKAPKLANA